MWKPIKNTNDGDCTIITYQKVGVNYTKQVYVICELKIHLFCFFILSTIEWIFIGMEKTSINCTKICNNSKRTKTSRNEVMQPTTSNTIRNQLFINHVHKQAGFAKPVINGRDFIHLGILKIVCTLGKLERLIFHYRCIILVSWKLDY